jgi:choline kinase
MSTPRKSVTTAKKNKTPPLRHPTSGDLSIIIPAAGMGLRMKSYGPKALIKVNNRDTLIERQIKILSRVYPYADIFIVVGFNSEKIVDKLKNYQKIRFIHNPIHDQSNVLYSIGLALNACITSSALVVYGDLIFNKEAVRSLDDKTSKVIVESSGLMRPSEVGVVAQNGEAKNFAFGLECKWGQIVYLSGKELNIMKRISLKRERSQWLGYEGLNYIMSQGGKFTYLSPGNMKIIEIDHSKDLVSLPEKMLTF